MEWDQSSIAGSGRCLVSFSDTDPGIPSLFLRTGGVALWKSKILASAAAGLQCVSFLTLLQEQQTCWLGWYSRRLFGQHVCGISFLFYGAKKCIDTQRRLRR